MVNRNGRIKHAITTMGVSQEALAERLGISQAAVNKQLQKEEEINSIKFLEAVSELSGYSFEWLRTGDTTNNQGLREMVDAIEHHAKELRKQLIG